MSAPDARSSATRDRILATAAVEFADRGYAATSIGDIAEKSGTAKGLVQYHFRAKADIAVAIVRESFSKAPFANVVETEQVAGISGIVASIRGVAGAFRDDVRVRAAVRLVREYEVIPVTFPRPYVGWMSKMALLLREAADAGEISERLDYDLDGWHLVATFNGVQETSNRLNNREDLPERIEEMLARVLPTVGVTDVARYLAVSGSPAAERPGAATPRHGEVCAYQGALAGPGS